MNTQKPKTLPSAVATFTLQTAATFLIILCSLEIFARTPIAIHILPEQSIGATHRYLDSKLTRLNSLMHNDEPLNCILLGDSTVNRGVISTKLHQSYFDETGEDLWCFNLGIGGAFAHDHVFLIDYLLQQYQFEYILWGTEASQFVDIPFENRLISSTEWARYQAGEFTIEGFLTYHSYAYRYFQGAVEAFQNGPEFARVNNDPTLSDITPYGYDTSTRIYVEPLNVEGNNEVERSIIRINSSIHFLSCEALSFAKYLYQLQQSGIEVVVFELPRHPERDVYLPNEAAAFRQQQARFLAYLESEGIPVVRLNDEINQITVNTNYWGDFVHLNKWGAELYSEWLASQLTRLRAQDYPTVAPEKLTTDLSLLNECV